MNPSASISFLLLVVILGTSHLVSASSSSSSYEPAKYRSEEDQQVQSSSYSYSYDNYDPKEQKVPAASKYKNYEDHPKDNHDDQYHDHKDRGDHDDQYHDHKDRGDHDDQHEPWKSTVFSLTVPNVFPDNSQDKKKPYNGEDSLSAYYYYRSCPQFESIVSKKVGEWVGKDVTLAASLLRLHFHDCAVRGCDASILLNHEGSERKATTSKTLRGFEVIDEIKAEVEKKCPRTVSCADILTAAARDAAVTTGGRYWTVDYGRKDGFISNAEEAESLVPMGRESITDLIEFFQSLGLDIDDLVALSGAHTIGKSSCGAIHHWLYNKTALPYQSNIDKKYLDYLQRKCRWASDYVELDPTTPNEFDNEYFINLIYRKNGLLSTDRMLYSDPRTSYIVKTLAYDQSTFFLQFKKSMKKLGNVQVLTGPNEGEIRTNCNFLNSRY